MTLRTFLKQIMFTIFFLIILLGFSGSHAEPVPVNDQVPTICDPKCGCDGMYIYDKVKEDCVLNLEKLMKRVLVRYENVDAENILAKDGMERSIYIEGQKIFLGIMVSVILFMTCSAICVVSACVYCCRINYSDHKLKKNVKALAKKMNKDFKPKRESLKPKVHDPKSQSCNIVIEEAGVYVV